MAGLPLVGVIIGLCLGGPVGLLAGAKLGGVAAIGGSLLGYAGASVFKEQTELRNYIDDHYKDNPALYVVTPRKEALLEKQGVPPRTSTEPIRHITASGQNRRVLSSRSYSSLIGPGTIPSRKELPRRNSLSVGENLDKKKQATELRSSYRKLGDLTEEEQRSVMALICSQAETGNKQGFSFVVRRQDIHSEYHHNITSLDKEIHERKKKTFFK